MPYSSAFDDHLSAQTPIKSYELGGPRAGLRACRSLPIMPCAQHTLESPCRHTHACKQTH